MTDLGLDEAILGFRTFYRCAVDPTFDCPIVGEPNKSDTPRPVASGVYYYRMAGPEFTEQKKMVLLK